MARGELFQEWEDRQIRKYYPDKQSRQSLAQELNRTEASINQRAFKLGLSKKTPSKKGCQAEPKRVPAPRNIEYIELLPIDMIKKLMKKYNLLQDDLAKLTGRNKSNISEMLSGKKKLSLSVMRALNFHYPELDMNQLAQPY